jgi:hypothetical protein
VLNVINDYWQHHEGISLTHVYKLVKLKYFIHLVKFHWSPGNFGGNLMLPFHSKSLFSGTHNYFFARNGFKSPLWEKKIIFDTECEMINCFFCIFELSKFKTRLLVWDNSLYIVISAFYSGKLDNWWIMQRLFIYLALLA